MEKFKGILLTLKKRVENIVENDNDCYKYLVMGYYDGLDINIVDKWYEMRPRGLRERGLQVDISSPFADQYTMRAFFPENRTALEKCGFDYKIWEQIGETPLGDFGEAVIDERKNNPYICMSILNIGEPTLLEDDLSGIPERIKEQLSESAARADVSLSELHCGIFPSIGYSDYIVLFLTHDLNLVSKVLGGLRREKGEQALVSGSYSVCGIDSGNVSCMDETECKDVQIALYINLREGISIENFIYGLEGVIKEAEIRTDLPRDYIEELRHFRTEIKSNIYLTFGYSDSMIVLYKSFSTYKRLYAENHILNPGHEFFEQYIGNIRTSVRMKGIPGQPEQAHQKQDKGASVSKKECESFIEEYSSFLEENDFPIRSAIGLKQIMKNYLNIASLSRSFDIEAVLGNAFSSLMNAVTYYINKPLELADDIEELKEEYELKIKNEYMQTVEAVKIYKEKIGDLIADLMRSDCAFIEGNTLSHPAIGSATKLLFAYTSILNELAEKYGESGSLRFIVTSGGCDRIESIDLFSFASSDEVDNLCKLIIISIPEMSLYDVRGTLFRILHECMHFLGSRNRRARYELIIHALSEYIAYDITSIRLSDEKLQEYIDCTSKGCDEALQKEISEQFEKCYREETACVQQAIAQKIQDCEFYKKYMDKTGDSFYHKREIFKNVLYSDRLAESLENKDDEAGLKELVYEILCNGHRKILEEFTSILQTLYKKEKDSGCGRKYRLYESCRQFGQWRDFYKYKIESDQCDQIEMIFVEEYFKTFLYQMPNEYVQLRFFYGEIVESTVSAMVESYSDCTAITLTGMQVEDFLLSFIYEVWDIDQAFPFVLADVLRIGADLKVMYGIEGKLGEEIEKRIKDKYEIKLRNGYKYKHVDKMIDRINAILDEYQQEENQGICRNVEKYIKKILGYEIGEVYPDFRKIYAECVFEDENGDSYVYSSINSMLKKWKELGLH